MDKEYTVMQIAIEGLEKYKIIKEDTSDSQKETSIDTVTKKVRQIIKEKKIEAVGKGKSTSTAKRTAKTYSREARNFILNEYLFDYFINMTRDEVIKLLKSPKYYEQKAQELNGEHEDKIIDFLELSYEQQSSMSYQSNNNERLTKYSKKVREKKNEIMLEAVFSKFYTLNIDELVEDLNKKNDIETYKTGDYDKDDIRIFEKISDWNNYVEKN